MADDAVSDELTGWLKRISVLKMQCKKHHPLQEGCDLPRARAKRLNREMSRGLAR